MKFLNDIKPSQTVNVDFTTDTEESRKLYWDDDNRTLSIEMDNNVIQQIGQEQFFYGRNNTISTIGNGTVCMVTGALGESARITIAPMVGDGTYNANLALGIATEDILSGEDGLITYIGTLRNIDTTGTSVGETWFAGDRLYAHPTIPGAMTKFQPQAPNVKVIVGRVLYVDATNGSIYVRVNTGSYLGGDSNVEFTDLIDKNIIRYNDTNKRWENIAQTDLELIASQVDITDAGDYYTGTEMESVLQEIGLDIETITVDLLDTMSTGITEFDGLGVVDTTHFSVGAVSGYIVNNTLNPESPTITRVEYAGSPVGGLTTPYLLTHQQTEVYIDNTNSVHLTNTPVGTASDRRDMVFLGRIIHPNDVIIAVENIPQVVTSPVAQLRDLWRAIGVINEGNYVYPNDANLQLALHGGSLHYSGLNFVTDPNSPTKLDIPSATPTTFSYRTQDGSTYDSSNLVDPAYYDLNGVRTSITPNLGLTTNQRVYLTRSGLIRIQYGQKVYDKFANAISGISTENFVVSDTLKTNAILIGIITLDRNATSLEDTTRVKFTGASKFGELGGGGGGGGAVNAVDVAVVDIGNYYTGTNAETVLQEIGYSLAHIVDTNTKTIINEGTAIDVSSSYNSGTDTYTYTINHEDTSTLTGTYGTKGIQSVTVDSLGHVTGVTTNTYLTSTTQSKDFGNIIVTDNDSGFTWSDTGSVVADVNADTVTIVSGLGIEVDADSVADAIRITNTGVRDISAGSGITLTGTSNSPIINHEDTSTITDLISDNSNGVVLQDIGVTYDTYGHAKTISVGTVDLDGRYYTESEVDTKLSSYQLKSEKDVANGYAPLDSNRKVPLDNLPSYVDDVLEYASLSIFPITGETGKIYVALDTNKTYRWSGSAYIYITSGAVDSVDGQVGVVNLSNVYEPKNANIQSHIASISNPHNVTAYQVGLGNVTNESKATMFTSPTFSNPELTGITKAPTVPNGTSDTQIATTAFVNAEIASDAAPISHVGSTGNAHGVATTEVNGFMSSIDKTKLDGIATNANNYTHPSGFTNEPTAILSGANVISQIQVTYEGHVDAVATRALTPVDISAEPAITTKNTAFNKNYGTTTADVKMNGVQNLGEKDELARVDHVHPTDTSRASTSVATTSVNGLMNSSDKKKLDGIEAGATADMTASEILASIKTVDGADSGLDADLLDAQHGSYYLNSDNMVDGTTNKVYTATEKTKLAGIATGANNYSHPTGFTNEPQVALTGAKVISQIGVTSEGHVDTIVSRDLTPSDISAEPAIGTKNTAFNKAFETKAANIKMNDGTSVGVLDTIARADHIHPTDTSRAAASHTHGNLTNDGKIGADADKVVVTTTNGVLTTLAEGTAFNTNFETNTANIKTNGTVSVGLLSTVARADHIHPTDTSRAAASHTHAESEITNLTTDLAAKQPTLVSGSNIKTINGSSILGSGDLVIQSGGGMADSVKNMNNTSQGLQMWFGTQAEYDAIGTKDPLTLYFCV